MAKKAKLDYSGIVKKLRQEGPERLYFLWGEEDYLREAFIAEIKKACLEDGDDSFNYRRFDSPALDLAQLSEAVDTAPFMAERSLIELRDFDINKCRDKSAEELHSILSDLPGYCTLIFSMSPTMEPDGRLKAVKNLKKMARAIEFTPQDQSQLILWLHRRFEAEGKSIGKAEAERLIYLAGSVMNALIPEIEKISAYSKNENISLRDIDSVTTPSPEANVFEMTDKLGNQNYDDAFRLLSQLLAMKEHPIMLLALIGQQFRKLYTARLSIDNNLGRGYVKEVCNVRMDFVADKLIKTAGGYSLERLRNAVELCSDTDLKMKSTGQEDTELLRELILRI